ncbi:MAG: hypothetical protein HYT27_00220 [Parcubacteria group bacterium]|nr:hypothetical protein [Parcubacteria group bacterium]
MKKYLYAILTLSILGSISIFNPVMAVSPNGERGTATISVFVEACAGKSVLSSVRDITWVGYRAYAVEKNYTPQKTLVAQFTDVPRGEFSVFVVIDGCQGARTGSFINTEPLQKISIIYNAKQCSFLYHYTNSQ